MKQRYWFSSPAWRWAWHFYTETIRLRKLLKWQTALRESAEMESRLANAAYEQIAEDSRVVACVMESNHAVFYSISNPLRVDQYDDIREPYTYATATSELRTAPRLRMDMCFGITPDGDKLNARQLAACTHLFLAKASVDVAKKLLPNTRGKQGEQADTKEAP